MPKGDDIVDIQGLGPADRSNLSLPIRPNHTPEAEKQASGGFLSLYFACANAYARAYKNPEGTAYIARCPTCGKQARFPVGEGGTSRRTFQMSCR